MGQVWGTQDLITLLRFLFVWIFHFPVDSQNFLDISLVIFSILTDLILPIRDFLLFPDLFIIFTFECLGRGGLGQDRKISLGRGTGRGIGNSFSLGRGVSNFCPASHP